MKTIIAKIVYVTLIFFSFVLPAHYVLAQEEFLLEAGKAVAIFGVKQIASAAYDSSCTHGKSNHSMSDPGGDLICMAVGGILNKDEKEFREDMRKGLEKLNVGLRDIETQLGTLREGQKELHKALDIVALAIDLIPSETAAHSDLIDIRGAWNDHFTPMINLERDFNHERNLAYAKYLIFTLQIERNLSRLNETLIRPNSGNKPALIEQHFNKIMAQLELSGVDDLEQPYRLFSSILESLLIEQARGEIMYAWAAAIIQAECAANGACDEAKKLPHNTDEFRAMAKRHRTEQLALFNRLVERMVLERSDLVSINANFLHHDAELVFASADLFSAIYMREGFGIRGRVISAGNAFSGEMNIGGVTIKADQLPRANKVEDTFDWWSKPKDATVYETLNFTKEWLAYDVMNHALKVGSYPIETEFPWKNGPVTVRQIDLLTGRVATPESVKANVVEFGSFLAIARAGGAYAVMHNAWDVGFYGSPSDAGGTSTAPTLSKYMDGKVVYTSKSASDFTPRIAEKDHSAKIERRRGVIIAEGGKVTVHMKMSPSGHMYPGNGPGILNADAPSDGAVIYYTDYQKPPFTTVSARFRVETGLFFSGKNRSESISWKVDEKPVAPTIGAVTHKPLEVKTLKFKSGEELDVKLTTNISFSLPTSGFDATSYKFFAGIAPTEIYFTKE